MPPAGINIAHRLIPIARRPKMLGHTHKDRTSRAECIDTEDGHIHIILEGSPRKSSRPNKVTLVDNKKTPGDSGEDEIVASANIALCIEELVRDFGLREREHEI